MSDAHHPLFPPSASARWLTCTASPLPISQGYEGDNFNEYAAEGSFAHRVFAAMVMNLNRRSPAPWSPFTLGTEYEQDGFKFTLDRAMVDYLQQALDVVTGIGAGVLMAEQRVGFDAGYQEGEARTTVEGTADVLLQPDSHPEQLHVFDLKYGRGVQVFAEENTQMMLYGLGSLATHQPLLFDSVQEVVLHVLQPRLDHWDAWSISAVALQEWGQSVVEAAVSEVLDGRGEYRPSEEACRWCPIGGAGECAAQVEHVTELFDALSPESADVQPENAVQLLSVDRLGELLTHGSWLERAVAAMRKRAETLELQGEDVPGWKLVLGRKPPRRWASETPADPGIASAIESAFSIEPMQEPKLKTPAAVEKEVGKRVFAAADIVVASVTQDEARPTLAPDDDRRAAWVPDTEQVDFDVDLGDLE